MKACALHAFPESSGVSRWILSAVVIVGIHAAAVAAALATYAHDEAPGQATPVMIIDLSPATAASELSPLDLAPGPAMQEAEAPSAEQELTTPAAVPPEIAPTPVQQTAPVPLPPDSKPAPPAEKHAPGMRQRASPKPQRVAKLQPSPQPPAPRTSAPPRADRVAPAAAAMAGSRAAAVLPSYRQLVAAHLQRFKRFPPGARAGGEEGVMLRFTISRTGRVLSARLGGSSGYADLDAEALSMVHRAQPLPPFPSELTQASMSFSVPVSYVVR